MADRFMDVVADIGSEEEDEELDEETGEPRQRRTNGADEMQDSSEEEEDDDDEERLREEGAGFIADEDDEEEEVESRAARRKRKKRKNREVDEELDEEDLDLIGEISNTREESAPPKYKRLKRGHREGPKRARGIDNIFSDDEADEADEYRRRAAPADEFADFIEEDRLGDDLDEDIEVGQPGVSLITSGLQAAGLDEGAEEDYRAAFGDGTDYDWALALQEQQDYEEQGEGRELELKDVFEPAQLAERMLTDEDNAIREIDIPERIQLARKPFKELELTDEAMDARLNEEAQWITNLLWPKKPLPNYFNPPFRKAVRKVLEFMNLEDYEVPFIFNHRKDYLIHAPSDQLDDMDADMPPMDAKPERLLNQSDLWEVFDLDLKFRAFSEKREALRMTYDGLKAISPTIQDDVVEELIDKAVSIEEVQELQDYLHFQYSAEIKDLRLMEAEANKTQKRANNARNFVEKIRGTDVYKFVLGLGIKADEVAKNAEANRRPFYEDPEKPPKELAQDLTGPPFETADEVLKAAKQTYIQELVTSPRLRRYVRNQFYLCALIDCIRTDKGLRKITEDHPYYEFKYLRGQSFMDLSGRPDLFLKMLKAEEEGLIQLRIRMGKYEDFKRKMYDYIMNDKVSELAQTWNQLRREMLDSALDKMTAQIATGVKENLRARCEDELAARARDNYANKLDQAPFKANHMDHGSIPNVLAISNGKGQRGDATCWAYVENDGRVRENGKLVDFRLGNPDRNIPDGADVERFVEVLRRRKPDVIGVSGFSVETRRLYKDLQEIINKYDIRGPSYDDDDIEKSDLLEVIMVNDEVARLYYMSQRANEEFPKLPYVTRYCVALARYLQNPLAEYVSLGKDVVSIPFVQDQILISQEKLLDRLENAMVDMVNLVGIDLREAYDDPYLSKLIPYVCGLGPRKADRLIKAIQANGDEIVSRFDLLGISSSDNDTRDLKAAMGPKVFQNAASFLYLEFDTHTEDSDYLDNTRVHPEDYDLARKMVADAMNMDEEDIKAEVDEGGPSAVVRRMVRDEQTDLIQDLILEDYASEIEKKLGHRKRATLETIRAELVEPYEEIRQNFAMISSDEIFTMLTGETKETLAEGMVIPVQIKRTFSDHIEVRLECGIEGSVSEAEFPSGVGGSGQEPRAVFQAHQTVRARVMFLNRKALSAQLSLTDDMVRKPAPRAVDRVSGEWDHEQEAADKKAAERAKEVASGRPNRVVNHPLFFQMNSMQAEEYLGSKEPGEVVIRPSSKGLDHLAVTWKVADNSYQHIDVLELGKQTEYSLGKQLRIGKYTYSDLDELIVNHVEAMAKKVTELTKDERFQKNGLEPCEVWLENYCKANPKRFMYAFCANPRYPGYFWLCYQAGANGPKGHWAIKIVPNAFELQKNNYPDITSLKNGFKILFQSKAPGKGAVAPVRR